MLEKPSDDSFVKGLKCRECGRPYPSKALYVCEYCFGPLEVVYDYEKIGKSLTKKKIVSRRPNMWRYRELLPIVGNPVVGLDTGMTPFFRADNLAKALGVKELYIKNDAVNSPTFSFKDRVVAVAISVARQFGFKIMACASTGNLGNAVASQSARVGMPCYIFIPADLEAAKILSSQIYGANLIPIKGTYDEVNRLCSEIAGKYEWAFANINIRPFYAEGSKTMGYELVEQFGWKVPQHVVVPCAGGSLITKVAKSFKEFKNLGFLPRLDCQIHAAQAQGCSPIVTAIHEDREIIRPVKPNTIAKSLAIGNPADGFYAVQTVKDSGGWGENPTDEEIVDSMKLLGRTEGLFTETAGGVTLGAYRKLLASGRIKPDESTVLMITGNGLKTQEAVSGTMESPETIEPKLDAFEKMLETNGSQGAPAEGSLRKPLAAAKA